eukprot:TRINITY_DN14218_c0_g1_i1.p1 TRINITY_DN14218_c0_g1~~TRINITY_DN14218_c0_g1_i1.p1  ORF type:complete len:150 (-),score=67.96 TRINITY_DN14218_c0_g1_i1:10-417(-)
MCIRDRIKSHNENTNALYDKQGDYVYESVAPDGIKRVLKEMVALSNGDKYYGFWNPVTNERDGKGAMIWSDGARYDGFWKNDKTHFKGRLIHANGDIYDGDWNEGRANGKGLYTCLLYTSPSPRDLSTSRMPSSA